MQIEEIAIEINNLKDLISSIDSNLKFNINTFLSMTALFVAVAGGALYLWSKSIVEKSVQTQLSKIKEGLKQDVSIETKQIKDELFELKGGLDQHILKLIENNKKIRWASGSMPISGNNQIFIGGLNGNIDWDSPITNVRVRDVKNKIEISFELIEKKENSFSFKVLHGTSTEYLEWIIVWCEKSR